MKSIQSYVRGGKHVTLGLPCEDRTFSITKNGVEAIALADGAGNQKYTHSGEGAECVVKTAATFLCDNFDNFYYKEDLGNLKKVFVAVLRKSLSALADELQLDSIMRLSSTILVAAVKDSRYITCHLGDGVIGVLTDEGAEVISAPNNGEFANETFFVPSPAAETELEINKGDISNIHAFFMMSDGTADYVYEDSDGEFSSGVLRMTSMLFKENGNNELEETIEKYMVQADSNSDDCSFAAMAVGQVSDVILDKLFGKKEDSVVDPVNLLAENEDRNQGLPGAEGLEEDYALYSPQKERQAYAVNINRKSSYHKKKKILIVTAFLSLLCLIALVGVLVIPKIFKDESDDTAFERMKDPAVSVDIEKSVDESGDDPVTIPSPAKEEEVTVDSVSDNSIDETPPPDNNSGGLQDILSGSKDDV